MAMTNEQLRAKIRDLIALGELPHERPRLHQADGSRATVCLICGEPDPRVGYAWSGRREANLHAACDALWKQEREQT